MRAGDERPPDPLPLHTTEEIGQVAHAVDELHTQALLLAGDEARLRLLVNDMFETMSRRNRSLVDQQLTLIDRLERNEENPDRLDSLFRLDHLAARMRRNGANLLVLSGAQISGGQRGPVPLSTVIDAATSEVEDYRRVQTVNMLDVAVLGAVSGDIIHLLAELIDNALRYSPPSAPVQVSAARSSGAGVLVQISDTGLGMTDADRRIANMRLRAGGEVTPENARRMGLFVVGRLADRHGLRVRLRGSAAGELNSGTTAEVLLPPSVLAGAGESDSAPRTAGGHAPQRSASEGAQEQPDHAGAMTSAEAAAAGSPPNGSSARPAALLPRRTPQTSGITDTSGSSSEQVAPQEQPQPASWWQREGVESAHRRPGAVTASDTSAYFSSRSHASGSPEAVPPAESVDEDDVIYQRMLSEWLVDPRELAHSADLDWKSVWDRGWSAAAEVDNVPIESHTDQGLPVREPGARLVPGTAASGESAPANGGSPPGRHEASQRDPDAVRSSISNHFSGVRAARSQARDSTQGPDSQ